MRRNSTALVTRITDVNQTELQRKLRLEHHDIAQAAQSLPDSSSNVIGNNYDIPSIINMLRVIDQDQLFPEQYSPQLGKYFSNEFQSLSGFKGIFYHPRITRGFSQQVNYQYRIPTVTPINDRPYSEVYNSLHQFHLTRKITEAACPDFNPKADPLHDFTRPMTLLGALAITAAAIVLYFTLWGALALLCISCICYTCEDKLMKFRASTQTNLLDACRKFLISDYINAHAICRSINIKWLYLVENSSIYYAQYYNLKGLIHLAEVETSGKSSLSLAQECFEKACTYSTDPMFAINHYQSMIFSNTHQSKKAQALREHLSRQYQTSWYMAGLDAKLQEFSPA